MALDATVPVLVSLVLLALVVVAAAATNRVVSRGRRRPVRPIRAFRWVASPLRCPRVVLIDELARTGGGRVAAAAS